MALDWLVDRHDDALSPNSHLPLRDVAVPPALRALRALRALCVRKSYDEAPGQMVASIGRTLRELGHDLQRSPQRFATVAPGGSGTAVRVAGAPDAILDSPGTGDGAHSCDKAPTLPSHDPPPDAHAYAARHSPYGPECVGCLHSAHTP